MSLSVSDCSKVAPEKPPGQKRRGRPPKVAGAPKRASFNTRLRDAVKERLELAAAKAGRSLSEEIEHRLERSLEEDRVVRWMEINLLPKSAP